MFSRGRALKSFHFLIMSRSFRVSMAAEHLL
jgi:hypothetical protein